MVCWCRTRRKERKKEIERINKGRRGVGSGKEESGKQRQREREKKVGIYKSRNRREERVMIKKSREGQKTLESKKFKSRRSERRKNRNRRVKTEILGVEKQRKQGQEKFSRGKNKDTIDNNKGWTREENDRTAKRGRE